MYSCFTSRKSSRNSTSHCQNVPKPSGLSYGAQQSYFRNPIWADISEIASLHFTSLQVAFRNRLVFFGPIPIHLYLTSSSQSGAMHCQNVQNPSGFPTAPNIQTSTTSIRHILPGNSFTSLQAIKTIAKKNPFCHDRMHTAPNNQNQKTQSGKFYSMQSSRTEASRREEVRKSGQEHPDFGRNPRGAQQSYKRNLD